VDKFSEGILFPREIKRVSGFLPQDDYFSERFFVGIRHERNRIAAPILRLSLRVSHPHAFPRIVDEIHSLFANARLSIRDAFNLRSSKTRSIRPWRSNDWLPPSTCVIGLTAMQSVDFPRDAVSTFRGISRESDNGNRDRAGIRLSYDSAK